MSQEEFPGRINTTKSRFEDALIAGATTNGGEIEPDIAGYGPRVVGIDGKLDEAFTRRQHALHGLDHKG